ncbi:hypothetical protein [Myceligenerans crystallogenes]|uniref:Immunity protein Imm1 n=1 Tax=Myceligenerans crystallogenes TaxID=316335 RepID=A0ABN2NBR7_9MICO
MSTSPLGTYSVLSLTTHENARPADIDTAWNLLAEVVELTARIGRDVITDIEVDPTGREVRIFCHGDELNAWSFGQVINPNRTWSQGLWFEPGTGDLYRIGSNVTETGLRVHVLALADLDAGDAERLPEDADASGVAYWL